MINREIKKFSKDKEEGEKDRERKRKALEGK